MDTVTTDWQSWAAIGVVALTALVFVLRLVLAKKSGGGGSCGSGCGCATAKPSKVDR